MRIPLRAKAYLLFIMFVAVIIYSCKKYSSTDYKNLQKELSESSAAAITRAKEAFINQSVDNRVQLTGKSLLSDSLLNHRTLLWSEAYTNISGDSVFVFVPIKIPVTLTVEQGDLAGTRLTDHLFLRMIDYGNGFKPKLTEMVSMIPDDSSGWKITQKFSGLLLLENWYFPFSSFIQVLDGKESPHSKKIMSSGGATTEGYFDCKTLPVTLCVGVEGYMNCETHTVTTCQGGGGGGDGGTGGGGVPPRGPSGPGGGGSSGSGGTGGKRELNTDAIREKFSCADKNILQPIFGSESMSAFVAPFLTDKKPTLTYNTASLPWGSTTTGGKFELGHAIYDPTSRTGLSSIVTLNEKMLENSSPLFAAVTTVHETIHGYINYNISLASLNVANDYSDYGNWMAALNGFYLIKGLPSNYSQHTVMLTDYFDRAIKVVTAWDQKQTLHHSSKEIAMAMMYGLNTVDPNTPQNLVDNINAAFELIKIKYEVTDAELDTFYKSQLNSLIKIPTDCN